METLDGEADLDLIELLRSMNGSINASLICKTMKMSERRLAMELDLAKRRDEIEDLKETETQYEIMFHDRLLVIKKDLKRDIRDEG